MGVRGEGFSGRVLERLASYLIAVLMVIHAVMEYIYSPSAEECMVALPLSRLRQYIIIMVVLKMKVIISFRVPSQFLTLHE